MREEGGRPIAPPPTYYYRRPLTLREMLPAVGVGLGVGVAAFYVARLMLERTPLEPSAPSATRSPRLTRGAPSLPRGA